MTERQLQSFRELLTRRLAELYRASREDLRAPQMNDPSLQEEPPRDEADESQRDQFRDLQFRLKEVDARLAQAIEGALGRMAAGEFGRCVECDNEIEIERLRAVPWAARCVDCQKSMESEQRQRPPTL